MRHLLLLFLALTTLSAAEPFSLTKLSAAGKDLTTLRVSFVQEKHLAILDDPVVSPGLIEISRPLSAVRWEYTGKSVMLFKDGRLRRFGAEGKEETITSKDQGVNSLVSQMKAFLNGDWKPMEELFTIAPAADGAPQLQFMPKTPDLAKYITSLTIRWRDDLTAPSLMTLVAAGDDRTEYRFEAPQLGIELPAARFEKP
ncbi:MAG TPA: outer membrane lipoprotein carrier protein LolA [Planctomycetota bacterium]|nr:outer membrane lipoprotein carrier protein LolA [Planctomycetota bacterium]